MPDLGGEGLNPRQYLDQASDTDLAMALEDPRADYLRPGSEAGQ